MEQTNNIIHTENAILVGLITQQQNERKAIEYINELEFLADTAGAVVVKKFFQRLDYANSKTFVGTGKLEEIKVITGRIDNSISLSSCQELKADTIVRILKALKKGAK